MKFIRVLLVGAALAGVLCAPGAARADDVARAKSDAGVGIATAVANLFYIPAKLCYAVVGGVTGGLGYLVTGGNKQVAERIWVSSFGGDYIVTREQLRGREPLHFSGSTDPNM